MPSSATAGFWPDGIRLVISLSMQFEAGGQSAKETDSPFPRVDFPDSVANTWFAYGYREGIPRMLDLWDRHGVKVTSHMIGEPAQRHPALAREIVRRGHEAAGHGPLEFAIRDEPRGGTGFYPLRHRYGRGGHRTAPYRLQLQLAPTRPEQVVAFAGAWLPLSHRRPQPGRAIYPCYLPANARGDPRANFDPSTTNCAARFRFLHLQKICRCRNFFPLS
jgi:hypothetical protein